MNKSVAIAAVALTLVLVSRALALSTAPDTGTKEGKVVSVGAGKLVLAEMVGKESTLTVSDSCVVMINGKMSKIEDLKKGTPVRIKTNTNGDVTMISTIDGPKERRRQSTRGLAADLPRQIWRR
jgi:hypothetical protein